ncbi:MAG: YihY/virulence factor BrkB family protein, partial [Proteobacteria bacterium]
LSVLLSSIFGEQKSFLWQVLTFVISFVGSIGVFALVFTYLPDVRVPRKDVILGAAITGALFQVGRIALGYYLGRGDYETSYGAAVGSFVALLVWVYYTSIIILIGAEVTQVRARRMGHEIAPEEHAVMSRYVEVVDEKHAQANAEAPNAT